jgi:menaquinone-dependent protoporphyrinogen oxidase
MLVLVTAASRHGSTTEVAATIGSVLTTAGHDVRVLAAAEVDDVTGFEAAVIGSCVYLGRWLEPARELVERNRVALGRIPLWLFSSGPVGDPPRPAEEPEDAVRLAALVGARGHRVFGGHVDRSRLGFAERAAVAAIRAPEGDFRRWDEIEAWARDIADALAVAAAGARTGIAT